MENSRRVCVQDVLPRLHKAKRNGDKGYMALCPYHGDTERSLHVGPGNGYHCYGCGKSGTLRELYKYLGGVIPEYYERKLTSTHHNATGKPQGVIVKIYYYRDEQCKLLYRVLRYDPKSFRLQRAVYEGGGFRKWVWNMRGVRRVLYNLPDILRRKDDVIIIVEGEKDADTLTRLGFLSTTTPMGANAWATEYVRHLRGRRVALIPDNDRAGKEYGANVSRNLGVACSRFGILSLPGLKEKGDVTDWVEAGGTAEELQRLIDEVLK